LDYYSHFCIQENVYLFGYLFFDFIINISKFEFILLLANSNQILQNLIQKFFLNLINNILINYLLLFEACLGHKKIILFLFSQLLNLIYSLFYNQDLVKSQIKIIVSLREFLYYDKLNELFGV
jgi:hypothetical protein